MAIALARTSSTISHGLILAALFAVLSAGPLLAKDYHCQAWRNPGGTEKEGADISLLKRMMIYDDGTGQSTARMFYGTLERNTYLDDHSAIVVHGTPTQDASGSPIFGDQIVVHRFFYDLNVPRTFSTKCRARK